MNSNKKKVVVLFGGHSSEYDVSLNSASGVIESIDQDRYEIILVGITREGLWLRYGGWTDKIRDNTWYLDSSCVPAFLSPSRTNGGLYTLHGDRYEVMPVDCAFPVLHGKNGEDGTIQGLFTLAGIPFVGCGQLSCAVCMDKEVAHVLVEKAGLPVPRSVVLLDKGQIPEGVEQAEKFGYPLFVKPANAGSSIGMTKAKNREELIQGIDLAFVHDSKVLLEECIEGCEVGCAILGNEDITIGAADEIELLCDFFDYHEKYTQNYTKIHSPGRFDEMTHRRIEEAAALIYRVLGCKGIARIDIFLEPDGRLVFNEANTMPGFTGGSRYPKMLAAKGLTYEKVVNQLIDLAFAEDAAGSAGVAGLDA